MAATGRTGRLRTFMLKAIDNLRFSNQSHLYKEALAIGKLNIRHRISMAVKNQDSLLGCLNEPSFKNYHQKLVQAK